MLRVLVAVRFPCPVTVGHSVLDSPVSSSVSIDSVTPPQKLLNPELRQAQPEIRQSLP